MKKVLVIGCPGSGKSTFSRALAEKTGLPLYHLDMLYWNPNRTTVDKAVFRAHLSDILYREAWIIDGNYASTMEMRMKAADTVFFLDLPTEVCLEGIRERQGKPRADMPWVEIEGERDEEFIRFVADYNTLSRPKVITLLEKYEEEKALKTVILKSREAMDAFLSSFEST